MTKEISEIIAAFKEAQRNGRQTALATVVHVEGSSYRRPGARMLVEDNGKMTGAISGGCLEGDALKKALFAMHQKQNKLVTYDTTDEEDAKVGVQLGCNGIVHILFEPIIPEQIHNPIALLELSLVQRKDAVLITLFSVKTYTGHQPGTCFFYDGKLSLTNLEDKKLEAEVKEEGVIALSTNTSQMKQYPEKALTAFIEVLKPPVSLIIVGAGNDALPIMDMAAILGWQITIVDGRGTYANKHRFSKATEIIVGKPAEAIQQVLVDDRTVFVLMTHNYGYDLEIMGVLLQKKCSYIGTLGPKKRLERMLTELEERGQLISSEQRDMIYGPAGLDIGAEPAEEIALSILSEIQAVLTKRDGSFLRNRQDGIHSQVMNEREKEKTNPR